MIREGLAMRRDEGLKWSQVIMAANAPMLYRSALLEGNAEVGVMATGQVVGLIDDVPSVAELIDRVIAEAGTVLDRLGAGRAGDENTNDDALQVSQESMRRDA